MGTAAVTEVYCDVVSRENRDFKTFLAVMPEHIRALKAGVKQVPAKKEAEPGPSSTNKRKAEPEKTAKVESATQPPVKVVVISERTHSDLHVLFLQLSFNERR